MPKITFTIDTIHKDKIIYTSGDKTYSLNTEEFLIKLGELRTKYEEEKWIELPANTIAYKKNTYKIVIKPYKDYISHRRKKYFVKWPELQVEVNMFENKISEIKVKTKIKNELTSFKAPNFDYGELCFGSYDPKIENINMLEKEIKKVFQVPFTEDYYEGNPHKFFETWEKQGYAKAYKLELEKES